jgi:F-type H+-transporting ATPase subunit epsilon
MPLQVDIVTIERLVYSEDADMLVAPGVDGEIGILPQHAPLITALRPGELRVTRGSEMENFAIGGGYLEVSGNRVTVLADTAERADEIDIARAQAARERAERLLSEGPQDPAEYQSIEGALRRSKVRLKVARKRRPTLSIDQTPDQPPDRAAE